MKIGTLTDGVIELSLSSRHPFGVEGVPPGYSLAILRAGTTVELGKLLLRVDEGEGVRDFAGNVAYEIAPEHRGHGYAARACLLARPLLREHLELAWILCDERSPASARTAEKIGAQFIDRRDVSASPSLRALGIDWVRRYRWRL